MRDERRTQHQPSQTPQASARRGASAPRGASTGRRPVYHISIVAEMVETHPQTLRMYERMGLITPQRTRNNIRLYSDEDVELVRRIQHLTQDLGVNLAGVEVVFKLLGEMERMRMHFEEVQTLLHEHGIAPEQARPGDGHTSNGNDSSEQRQSTANRSTARVIEVQVRKGRNRANVDGADANANSDADGNATTNES